MARRKKKQELETRAEWALIGHAIFRIESALTIALVIMLAYFYPRPFPWWRWWYWIILGVIGEILIFYTSLTDLRTGQKVVADMLRQEFNPREIRTSKYRQRLEEALEYRERIDAVIKRSGEGVLHDHLNDTTRGISDWIASIYRMGKRLDAFENDTLVRRDTENIPKILKTYGARLALEDDPKVRKQMEEAIAGKEAQLRSLEELANVMERAEFQLETTLSALGTVYSQLLLIGAKDIDSSRSRDIAQKIRDQVNQLQDILTTMDEVYARP